MFFYPSEPVATLGKHFGRPLVRLALGLILALLIASPANATYRGQVRSFPGSTERSLQHFPAFTPQERSSSPNTALRIEVQARNSDSVPLYGKFEVTFSVTGTVALNLQFPYDAAPTPGMEGRVGVTVDGLFLPPGDSDWSTALVQPAFLYQPYLYEEQAGQDWIYPVGDQVWKLRFAAQVPGVWRYKIRAQDASICSAGVTQCDEWVESPEGSFEVESTSNGNPGFVEVSSRDPRYFEFSNDQPFIGVGHATDFESLVDAKDKLAKFGNSRANFFRVWMSASVIFGRGYFLQQWDPWSNNWPTTDQVAEGSDFSVILDDGNPCIFFWQGDGWPAFEAGKTYRVRVKAKLMGVNGPQTAGQVHGLTVTFNNWWGNICNPDNITMYLTQDAAGNPVGDVGTQDWHWFEGVFTNTGERLVAGDMGNLVVGLVNTTGGEAYLDEIYIGEDLGGGKIGPNVIGKAKFNYHEYFDQQASWFWDQVLEEAAAQEVYLKLVIMEKNDGVFNQIKLDGTYDSEFDDFGWNENFHAWPDTRVRRLHEYFWRYLTARWGYSTAVHSWELVNEGAPGCENVHMHQAQALTDYIRAHDPNGHLTMTSFWAGHTDCYYGRDAPFTPDYGDFHAYTTVNAEGTGWLDVDSRDGVDWHLAYSNAVRADTDVPIVWGEKGIARENNPDNGEDPRVSQDTEGIWLHNQTWAWLEPGALYTLYWYNDSLVGNDLYPVFKGFRDFMDGIPLSNGNYVDVAATVSNSGLRVLGQKDSRGVAAHFWVQNRDHTWWNVVRGTAIAPQSADVTVAGLTPGVFTVQEWNTYRGEMIASWQTTVDAAGELTVQVDGLRTDVAYRLYAEDSPPAVQLSYNKWANSMRAAEGETITYTLSIVRQGTSLTAITWVTDTLPPQLDFVDGSLSANAGTATYQNGRVYWAGLISATPRLTVTYQMTVPTSKPMIISNVATFYNAVLDPIPVKKAALVWINEQQVYLPLVIKQ